MRTTIRVQNLKCGGCAKTITSHISKLENISSVEIDIDHGAVTFCMIHPNDGEAVLTKLKDLGYPSINEGNSMISKVKSYVSCASGKIS
ncbi:heavy-metal-associated domain-containing protein [Psychroserpens sp. BH13MA-6]